VSHEQGMQEMNKVSLINRALMLQLGNPAVYSIGGNDPMNAACDAAWDETLYACFSLHDWSFARRTLKLVRLADAPENGFEYGFQLPGNRLGQVLKVMSDPRNAQALVRDYTIEGDVLTCDVIDVWARVKLLVEPEHWDGAFTAAFVVALGAKLAIALTQDEELAAQKTAEAFGTPSQGGTGGLFGRLIAQDRAAEPMAVPLYWQDPLTQARWQ